MTDLTSLIEKLEKAERSSDELDAHIRCALLADKDAYVERSAFNGAWCVYSGEYNGRPRLVGPQHNRAPHSLWVAEFTRSIDAATSLAERVLPNWQINLSIFHDTLAEASFGNREAPHARSLATKPALAICLATLRALQQKGSSNG